MNATYSWRRKLAGTASMSLMLSVTPGVFAAEPVTAALCGAGACVAIPPPVAVTVITAAMLKDIVRANVLAAGRESGELSKLTRLAIGVSLDDIEKHGLCGGPGSVARQLGCK